MRLTKLIAMSKNLDDDWIKVEGHERSRSKKCRAFLQRVNKAMASVYKAGVSSVVLTHICQMDFPTIIIFTSPLSILGESGVFFTFISYFL